MNRLQSNNFRDVGAHGFSDARITQLQAELAAQRRATAAAVREFRHAIRENAGLRIENRKLRAAASLAQGYAEGVQMVEEFAAARGD